MPNALKLATRLVEIGLWERVDGGFAVHDYLEYQASKERVQAERRTNAARQERFRKHVSNAVTKAATDGVSNAAPIPSHPNPNPHMGGHGGSNGVYVRGSGEALGDLMDGEV
jgi:hypothetical protein